MRSRSHALRWPGRAAWRLPLIVALIAVSALICAAGGHWLQTGVLSMLPAVALAIVLLTRRYPGESVLARVRASRSPRPCAATLSSARRRADGRIARGGSLIAVAMAGRAPPCTVTACR